MNNQVIVVTSKGNKTKGVVKDAAEVKLPSKRELENAIHENMIEVAAIASGANIDDPTKPILKHCSSCLAMGRQPFHTVNYANPKRSEFTILKNGKAHSQCKKCRSEQACAWQKTRRHPDYQRNYQRTYPRKSKGQRIMEATINEIEEAKTAKLDGLDSMFVARDTNPKV